MRTRRGARRTGCSGSGSAHPAGCGRSSSTGSAGWSGTAERGPAPSSAGTRIRHRRFRVGRRPRPQAGMGIRLKVDYAFGTPFARLIGRWGGATGRPRPRKATVLRLGAPGLRSRPAGSTSRWERRLPAGPWAKPTARIGIRFEFPGIALLHADPAENDVGHHDLGLLQAEIVQGQAERVVARLRNPNVQLSRPLHRHRPGGELFCSRMPMTTITEKKEPGHGFWQIGINVEGVVICAEES